MTLDTVGEMFNRALANALSWKKLLLTSAILSLCGLLLLFFRALAEHANQWMILSLTFIPIFLCVGIMMAMGIILIRIYHHDLKQKPISYRKVVADSWELALASSYFAIPIILCYLVLWIALGIFIMLAETPLLGPLFSSLLSFAPFILNIGLLLLALSSIAMLYIITPSLAFKGLNRLRLIGEAVKRIQNDPFGNILLGGIALTPLLAVGTLLITAAALTESTCFAATNSRCLLLQWFFMMIPFASALSPGTIFFFNFATEAHIWSVREK